LNKLADEAIGLQYMYVYLDADMEDGHYGAGRDLNFMQALGRIKVSQKIDLCGYFAAEWPSYLKRKLGMSVWNTQCHSRQYLQWLREYQQGTECVVP
jgi:hypothetical protein